MTVPATISSSARTAAPRRDAGGADLAVPDPGAVDRAGLADGRQPIIAAIGGLPAQIRRTLTWDCGAEMARYATITATGLPVYFAHPHSPWERGSNENLNQTS